MKKAEAPPTTTNTTTKTTDDDGSMQASPVFHLLPAPCHHRIATLLPNNDINHMMETGRFAVGTYGNQVKKATLPRGDTHSSSVITSYLQRRPGLEHVEIGPGNSIIGFINAVDAGYWGGKVQSLSFHVYSWDESRLVIGVLHFLQSGPVCPQLNQLSIGVTKDTAEAMTGALADTLRARLQIPGCSTLTKLRYTSNGTNVVMPSSYNLVLSSGACDAVEDMSFVLVNGSEAFYRSLSHWLTSTHAPRRLHTLKLPIRPGINSALAAALASPGTAPHLRCLELGAIDREVLTLLCPPLERAQWPDLAELKLYPKDADTTSVARFMEGIRLGAPNLQKLSMCYSKGISASECIVIGQGLKRGAAPRLEELELRSVEMRQGGARGLFESLASGAQCNATLRRLVLNSDDLGPDAMKTIAECLARGACPALSYLDLSMNPLKDQGLEYLAAAISKGALPQLQELHVNFVEVNERGTIALVNALSSRSCCVRLEKLEIRNDDYMNQRRRVSYTTRRQLEIMLYAKRGTAKPILEVDFGKGYDEMIITFTD